MVSQMDKEGMKLFKITRLRIIWRSSKSHFETGNKSNTCHKESVSSTTSTFNWPTMPLWHSTVNGWVQTPRHQKRDWRPLPLKDLRHQMKRQGTTSLSMGESPQLSPHCTVKGASCKRTSTKHVIDQLPPGKTKNCSSEKRKPGLKSALQPKRPGTTKPLPRPKGTKAQTSKDH